MKFGGIGLFALPLTVILFGVPQPLSADSVLLRNGALIEGKVTDLREKSGQVIVEIGTAGRILLRGDSVIRIAQDNAPAAPPANTPPDVKAGDFVHVRLPEIVKEPDERWVEVEVPFPGTAKVLEKVDKSGRGNYYGVLSPESTENTIVLDAPGAGKIRLLRTQGSVITKSDAMISGVNPPQAAPAGTAIATTHVIHLRNGRKIQGTLVPTPETEPLKLRIGQMGSVTIPREEIEPNGIEAVEGTIQLSTPAGGAGAPAAPGTDKTPKVPISTEVREELKRELRQEILREVLDKMIDQKIDEAVERGLRLGGGPERPRVEGLPPEEVKAIEDAVYELTRWRARNRVRAERHLVEMGSVVLPYLEGVAQHPFWLTRRAVQRIVREIGDLAGAPLAIRGLNDQDHYVRELAHDALRTLLPSSLRYSPSASEAERLTAQTQYYGLWDASVRDRIRDSILAQVEATR